MTAVDGLLLLRTVRHLKPAQIYGRLVEPLPRPLPRAAPAPPARMQVGSWVSPIVKPRALVGPGRLRLLNAEGEVAAEDAWNDPGRPKLWLYNLHYFDALSGLRTPTEVGWARRLIDRWIDENPPGLGVGWEPYPVSLRIVNWIKWALSGAPFEPRWRESLAAQARWLERRVEWRLLGNHLIANAKALIFAGLFFAGPEAERWLAGGLGLLRQQIDQQILRDGGHCERSPMYHAIVLEDLLDLINLSGAMGLAPPEAEAWRGFTPTMRRWLLLMSHPDGQIGFFNDAAFGVAAPAAAIEAYASRLGLDPSHSAPDPVEQLAPSGYLRLALGDAVMLVDAAPIGPDYLPGHAHADTLSFELSLGAERVVVNGGTSVYGEDARRQAERSTASHSTVEIDGQNSSEVWAGFRVGRRARPQDVKVSAGPPIEVSAAHDGYRALPGRPLHRRRWRLEPRRLSIADAVEGGLRPGLARYHLAPGVAVEAAANARSGVLTTPSGRRIGWAASEPARVEASEWRPEFGVRLPTIQLVAPVGRGGLDFAFEW